MQNPPDTFSPVEKSFSDRRDSGWDIKNAVGNYASLVVAHGATATFSFASVWLITKYLGSEGYGGVIAFVAASQLVQIFINWSTTALARFGIEEFVETGRITRSFWSRTLILVPNLILVLATTVFWLQPIAELLKIPPAAVWLIGVHLSVTCIWLHIQYSMQAVKMLRLQGAMLAGERALTFIGVLTLIVVGRISWENALWCYIIPPAILSIAGAAAIWKYLSFTTFIDREQLRKMLVFSAPLIPFALVGYLSTSQLDAFFITKYLSTRDLGIYAVAAQISGMTVQLLIVANTVLLSMFVSLKTAGQESILDKFITEAVPAFTLGWSMICVAVSFTSVLVLPVVFGSEFLSSWMVLWILMSASVFLFPVYLGFASLSNAYSKTYVSMYASIAAAICNITFNIALIPRFGMVGCAWATVLSAFTSLTIFYGFLRKSSLISRSWVFMSILPATASSLAISIWSSATAGLLVFVFLSFLVAYFFRSSIKYAIRVIKGKINVKDVPPEPALR